MYLTRNQAYRKVPWVRIPPSPPKRNARVSGHFSFPERSEPAGSRVGFEGNRLQAIPRPALVWDWMLSRRHSRSRAVTSGCYGRTMVKPLSMRRKALLKPSAADVARELHREKLRGGLLATVETLRQRRADLLSDECIDEYVAIDWLEWNGGSLRLTQTGKHVCQQMQSLRDNVVPTASPKGRILPH
jgi:hypothetical protein